MKENNHAIHESFKPGMFLWFSCVSSFLLITIGNHFLPE